MYNWTLPLYQWSADNAHVKAGYYQNHLGFGKVCLATDLLVFIFPLN